VAQQQRRLAAILLADVAGYSRLMAADEAGTLARFNALRAEVLDPKFEQYQGRVVGSAGDSLLVEFASAVDAVQCAVETQARIAAGNAEMPEDQRIVFRMGINLGDIIADGDTIHGDGVNIAARLEKIAEPGGIVVADTVQRQVKGKIGCGFEDLGDQAMHNIAEPVRAFRVVVAETGPTRTSDANRGRDSRPIVAVLPFTNMSGDPEQEYFSDGITEDIITELSRFRSLMVLARNSTFAFKGKAMKVEAIARNLGCDYVVEGSVRRASGRVRVTAQLIESQSGGHLWAERYDRDFADIFAVQDDLTRRIVATAAGRVLRARVDNSERKSPQSISAYDLYLKGRHLVRMWTKESSREARAVLEEALRLDPKFGPAWAALSSTYYSEWCGGWSKDPDATVRMCARLAHHAYNLGDDDDITITSVIGADLIAGHHAEARRRVRQLVALNPSNADCSMFAGYIAAMDGDPDESVELVKRAQDMNPLGRYGLALGSAFFVARRDMEAIELLRDVRATLLLAPTLLIASLALAGRIDEARDVALALVRRVRADLAEIAVTPPDDIVSYLAGRIPLRRTEDRQRVIEGLRLAGVPQ